MKKKREAYPEIAKRIKEQGLRMDFVLREIGISRSHFYFVRKGERNLDAEKKAKLNKILNTNY